jgi:hypothetical protein
LPELGEVTGKVTLNGVPQKDLQVMFHPVEGGATAIGVTDATGRYTLAFGAGNSGAKIGKNKVTINWKDGIVTEPYREDDGTMVKPKVQPIPKKYNEATELEKDVESGAQEINFELSSI